MTLYFSSYYYQSLLRLDRISNIGKYIQNNIAINVDKIKMCVVL